MRSWPAHCGFKDNGDEADHSGMRGCLGISSRGQMPCFSDEKTLLPHSLFPFLRCAESRLTLFGRFGGPGREDNLDGCRRESGFVAILTRRTNALVAC